MAKVIKQHQQTFPQYTHHSTGNGSVTAYTTKARSGYLRAPKRSIPQQRRYSSRARREQKLQSADDGKFNSSESGSPQTANSGSPPSKLTASSPENQSTDEQRSYDLADNKRARPENNTQLTQANCTFSSNEYCSDQQYLYPAGSRYLKSPISGRSYMCCKLYLIDKIHLQRLLADELNYHPNNAFLYYVNPEVDDKVDVALRNEAVQHLRFLHNAFFNLTTDTFCKAVNVIDRFIVKVKVKPKYMACVATASYCLASRLTNSNIKNFGLPDPDTVVCITRCGGNAADLMRMEEILASKLAHDLDGVNAFDFLQLFANSIVKTMHNEMISSDNRSYTDTDSEDQPNSQTGDIVNTTDIYGKRNQTRTNADDSDEQQQQALGNGNRKNPELIKNVCAARGTLLYKRFATLIEIALCSLEVYRFRPACLALAIIAQFGVEGLLPLAKICNVDWYDVCDCANLVGRLYDVYHQDLLPISRRQFGWIMSYKRNCRIGYSSPTPLDTISEDHEPTDEDDWVLSLLFEP